MLLQQRLVASTPRYSLLFHILLRVLSGELSQTFIDLCQGHPASSNHDTSAPREVDDALQRVRVEQYKVGAIAHSDGAEPAVLLQHFGDVTSHVLRARLIH